MSDTSPEVVISADSHVHENLNLWLAKLPPRLREAALAIKGFDIREGSGPIQRVREMARDGVSAEVIYTTRGMPMFALRDVELQEALFRIYNDWLIEFCQAAPERLIGIALISAYDPGHAVAELRRCREAGLRGAMLWQAPPPELPFYSEHYSPIWAAAQELQMPISLHILTGFDGSRELFDKGVTNEVCRISVNAKLSAASRSLFQLLFFGVMDRFPNLKFVLVEQEFGWLPFLLERWDRYYEHRSPSGRELSLLPSEYFKRQVYATFFNDNVGCAQLGWWHGAENMMWSSDFPHPNSSWPNSRQVITRLLGKLPVALQRKLLCTTVAELYGLEIPAPLTWHAEEEAAASA